MTNTQAKKQGVCYTFSMKRLFFLLSTLLLTPALALAQFVPEDVSLDLNPRIPAPNQTVEAEVTSYAFDLQSAQISWYLNGTLVQQSRGVRQFRFTTGSAGQTTTLRVSIQPQGAPSITKSISFIPASVELLYEPEDSFVPAFYKGKKLNAHESGVEMVAMPYFVNASGQVIDPSTLVYTWRIGNQIQQNASGYGRQTFNFIGPSIYRNKMVTVDVSTVDGTISATRSRNMVAYDPLLLFYKTDPLRGINLNRAASQNNIYFPESEITMRAVPYYLSDANNYGRVEYEWQINGDRFVTVGDRNEITLTKTEGQSGEAQINLDIKNVYRLLQYVENGFSVLFGSRAPQNGTEPADYFEPSL